MTAQFPGGFDPQTINSMLREAFEKKPDSAGILQGVRKLRHGRPHTRTILFPSPKNKGYFIPCDGSLEPEMALALELSPLVPSYRGQPFSVPGPRGRDITPDFAINFGNGFSVIDVKPKARRSRPRVVQRMQHIRCLLGEVRIPHYVFTEEDLCQDPFHQIRHQLKKGLRIKVSTYEKGKIFQCFKGKTTTVGELRKRVISIGLKPHIIEAAAAANLFQFTINTHWGNHTQLGANHDDNRISTANWGTLHDICPSL
jgi:hypothetical protein